MKYCKNWKQTLACMTLIALVPLASVEANIIFSDDFEAQTIGVSPGSPWSSVEEPGNIEIRVREDDSNLFGLGTDNQILQLSKTTGGDAGLIRANSIDDATTLATLDMNFYHPASDGRIVLRLSSGGSGNIFAGDTAFQLDMADGIVTVFDGSTNLSGNYQMDTLNSLSVVANSSNVSTTYGGKTLAANSADIWLNGNLLIDGGVQRNQQGQILDRLSFHIFGGETDVNFYVDDIQLQNVAIPEPGTLVLLGFAFGLIMYFRRRN
ncbi:MAG: PEP-CTERM sorting domain-containing protein [Verrucomicrobia bacterium]|nr:PEP-CTERM sorting domain-containing protein [Verrucomicrobiota bacterium]